MSHRARQEPSGPSGPGGITEVQVIEDWDRQGVETARLRFVVRRPGPRGREVENVQTLRADSARGTANRGEESRSLPLVGGPGAWERTRVLALGGYFLQTMALTVVTASGSVTEPSLAEVFFVETLTAAVVGSVAMAIEGLFIYESSPAT